VEKEIKIIENKFGKKKKRLYICILIKKLLKTIKIKKHGKIL
jgi:hypothetical protein